MSENDFSREDDSDYLQAAGCEHSSRLSRGPYSRLSLDQSGEVENISTAMSHDSTTDSTSDSQQMSSSQSSDGRSTQATSDDGNSNMSNTNAESFNDRLSENETTQPSKDAVIDIDGSKNMKGFVLFTVRGSRGLCKARTRLEQIHVEDHGDDHSFFMELRQQYRHLRGGCLRILSIWNLGGYEFMKVKAKYTFYRWSVY